jgi:uncharacterized protein (TIGR02996 family)
MDHEHAFLEEILAHPKDETTRLVYADWLEEQGDLRAEFLRLEVAMKREPTKWKRDSLRKRLRKMREGIDLEWVALLDQTRVENCNGPRFAFQCDKRWEDLGRTEDDLIRFCDDCRQNVYHCGSVEEANRHAQQGHCVAVDSREPREKGDLQSRSPRLFMTVGRIEPSAPGLLPGQRIRFRRGSLAGREGVVERVRPGREGLRITVGFRLSNQVTRVEVESADIEAVP